MNYKQFLTHLKEDYSVDHLQKILNGKVGFNPKLTTKLSVTQRKYLFEKYLPKIIKQLERDNEKDILLWQKAPILKLAFVRCQQKKLGIEYLFDEAMNIVNHLNCDNKGQAISQRFKEYYKHTKNGDYNNGTFEI